MKKLFSCVMVTVILLSMLILAFRIQSVASWTGTAYIRADGSVDPSDAPISSFDNITYSLVANITSSSNADGIVVERDNLMLDGGGCALQGQMGRGIFLSGRTNVTIRNMQVKGYGAGIYLSNSSNSKIATNIVADNVDGVWLKLSSDNTVIGNDVKTSYNRGITLKDSSNNNIVAENNATDNGHGIMLWNSNYNSVFRNIVTENISGTTRGLYLTNASRNDIFNNSVTDNTYGVAFDVYSSFNNVYGNTIRNNTYGVAISISPSNTLYHNNFFSNTNQAFAYNSSNVWDNGAEGNYWSDYAGIDGNGDGIGDTPYTVDSENQDNHPLMNPYVPPGGKHQISLLSVESSKTLVMMGKPMLIDVLVKNTGDYAENFEVTAYANNIVIGTKTVRDIEPQETQTVTFLWQTSGYMPSSYIISSILTPVSGETQIINNGQSDVHAIQIMGDGCVILVAGNRYDDNQIEQINYETNHIYKILRDAGYSKEDIYLMHQPKFGVEDVDNDGYNDVDNNSTRANLQWAIESWAKPRVSPNNPLFIVLDDHGGYNFFSIDRSEFVRGEELAAWIQNLESDTNTSVHVIYSACMSGSFIDDLSKTGRVVATSCAANQNSYGAPFELFFWYFWKEIQLGHSVGWSFITAGLSPYFYAQTPLLDDNGDYLGQPVGELSSHGEGLVAANLYIGRCEWPSPWISSVVAEQNFTWPPPSIVTLWAQIKNETNLVLVRACLLPPDWVPPATNETRIVPNLEYFEMADPDHDGNWTVNIPAVNFTNHASGPSNFTFFIIAEEENSDTTTPGIVNVEFTETGNRSTDMLKPVVNVERPLEETVVHNVICVNGTVSDDTCVKRVELYVDGILSDSEDLQLYSTSYFAFNLNTTTLQNGARTILVKAFDISDNTANQSLTVYVNNFVHDVTVTDITPSETTAAQGETVNINVTVADHGSYAENFNLTLYANASVIASQVLTLQSEDFNTISFAWNTTGLTNGNYTLSAYAWPVTDEIDTTNNNLTLTEQPIVIIPEFLSPTIILAFMITTLFIAVIYRKKRTLPA